MYRSIKPAEKQVVLRYGHGYLIRTMLCEGSEEEIDDDAPGQGIQRHGKPSNARNSFAGWRWKGALKLDGASRVGGKGGARHPKNLPTKIPPIKFLRLGVGIYASYLKIEEVLRSNDKRPPCDDSHHKANQQTDK